MEQAEPNISSRDLAIVRSILQCCVPEIEVWAFGSRIAGRAKPYSDLDLALVSKTYVSLATLAELECAFEESDLPFRVDLVDIAGVTPAFRSIIEQCKFVLQKAEGASPD